MTEPTYSDKVFSALEQGLTVELIATNDLVTCIAETPAVKVAKCPEFAAFDFVPVRRDGQIVGLLDRVRLTSDPSSECDLGQVRAGDRMAPLSERNLISADTGILEFVERAAEQPCRLVVRGTQIAGIVTTADAQKLAARPAFFLLVTHVELLMTKAIRGKFKDSSKDWMDYLKQARKSCVERRFTALKKQRLEPLDKLTATFFCDKREIILRSGTIPLDCGKNKARDELEKVEELRNFVSHPDDHDMAINLATELVAKVKLARKWIRIMEQSFE